MGIRTPTTEGELDEASYELIRLGGSISEWDQYRHNVRASWASEGGGPVLWCPDRFLRPNPAPYWLEHLERFMHYRLESVEGVSPEDLAAFRDRMGPAHAACDFLVGYTGMLQLIQRTPPGDAIGMSQVVPDDPESLYQADLTLLGAGCTEEQVAEHRSALGAVWNAYRARTPPRPAWEIHLEAQLRESVSDWDVEWGAFAQTLGICAPAVRWLNREEGLIRDGEGQNTYPLVADYTGESRSRAAEILRNAGATGAQIDLYLRAHELFWIAHQRRPEPPTARDWVITVVGQRGSAGQSYPGLLEIERFGQEVSDAAIRQLIRENVIVLREGMLYLAGHDPALAWENLPIHPVDAPPVVRTRLWPPTRAPQTSEELAEAVAEMRSFGDRRDTIDLYTNTVIEMWGRQDMADAIAQEQQTALDAVLDDDWGDRVVDPTVTQVSVVEGLRTQDFEAIEGDLDDQGRAIMGTARPAQYQDFRIDVSSEGLTAWVTNRLRSSTGPVSMTLMVAWKPIGVTEQEMRRVLQTGLEQGLWKLDRGMHLVSAD